MKFKGVSREQRRAIIYPSMGVTRTMKADCQGGYFAPLGKQDGPKELRMQILDILDFRNCVLFRPADKYGAEQREPTDYKQIFFTLDDGIVRDIIVKKESATNIETLEETIQADNLSTKHACDFWILAKMSKRQTADKKSYYAVEFSVENELPSEIQKRNQAFIESLGDKTALFNTRTHVEFVHYKKNLPYREITKEMIVGSLVATKVLPNSRSVIGQLSVDIGEPVFDEYEIVDETQPQLQQSV